MKALVKYGKGQGMVELRDIPKPVPKDDELLVKVMAAGICGTDIHIQDDEYPYAPPITLGHEFTGVIESMGKDVKGWEAGEQIVAFTGSRTCGQCRYCKAGLYMLCKEKKGLGAMYNGAMAEYVVIPAQTAFRVPKKDIGKDFWAAAEPAACCVRAVIEQSSVTAGDVAVLVGPGTMGLLAMQMAIAQGATVIAAGMPIDKDRLVLAKKMGAAEICDDPKRLPELIKKYTPYGADVAIECSGSYGGLLTCIDSVRANGTIQLIGVYGKPGMIDMTLFEFKELNCSTNYASEPSSWERLISMAAHDKINLESIIGARLPLEDWEKGFQMHRNKEALKILLVP